jgi:hypothetical protein
MFLIWPHLRMLPYALRWFSPGRKRYGMNLWPFLQQEPKAILIYQRRSQSQGAHSVEEYFSKLWEVLYPAKIMCNLVSNDPDIGFIIINTGLFIVGFLSWIYISEKNNSKSLTLLLIFLTIEIINGIGHPLWALFKMQYEPGLFSALIILLLDIYLIRQLFKQKNALVKQRWHKQ